MTDAPFTETHRVVLEAVAETGANENPHAVAAITAALAEIDRLTKALAVQILLVDTYSTRWEEAEEKLSVATAENQLLREEAR